MLKKIFFFFLHLSSALLIQLHASEVVNVGIYQNAPKIFIDQEEPSGFFVDILNDIAQKEGWKLNYIRCNWSECLEMLQDGRLDIMPDVAYSFEREEKFLFSKESLFSSWSLVYRDKDVEIDSILDLEAKRVAVLKGSIQHTAIKKLLLVYNVQPDSYKEVSSFVEAFELLKNHQVDCVIVNRFYELNNKIDDSIVKTNVLIEPSMIKYAFSTKREDLVKRVDVHLQELKKDKSSIFYQAQEKWLTPKTSVKIPSWLLWTIASGIVVILILLLLVILFQRAVTRKTQELLQKEEMMIIQSKHAAMGEMIGLIAHQWRQPLSVISMSMNNIQLSIDLEEQISNQDLFRYIESVSDEVKHLSSTIDDFRNFFKPNKTKTTIPISHVIEKVNKILATSLQNNNIEFIVQNELDYEICTYPNELLQVLLNIINNAKDILKDNDIQNAKIVMIMSETSENYTISIYDNGGGIPEDIIDKIGRQYFTTKAEHGTGLGLYMSLIIVQQHLNGTLEWENKDGGACFTITINKENT